MPDEILIADDPWSREYWQHRRIAPLVDSVRELMRGNFKVYMLYWMERCAGAPWCSLGKAKTHAKCVQRLAQDIAENGYNPHAWREDPRHEKWEADRPGAYGPLSVTIGPDGRINPWDGAHRSAILRVLGKECRARVYQRSEEWRALLDFNDKPYTPYPHPDMNGRQAYRPGTERFSAIADFLAQRKAKRCLFVGACTGFGMAHLAARGFAVDGIEPHPERFKLAEAYLQRVSPESTLYPLPAFEFARYGDYDAVIGLAVWHHVATSLKRWVKVLGNLATCPIQIVELAGNEEGQWHDDFREYAHGMPGHVVFESLIASGQYTDEQTIFTDTHYANRPTVALWR